MIAVGTVFHLSFWLGIHFGMMPPGTEGKVKLVDGGVAEVEWQWQSSEKPKELLEEFKQRFPGSFVYPIEIRLLENILTR